MLINEVSGVSQRQVFEALAVIVYLAFDKMLAYYSGSIHSSSRQLIAPT